MASMDESYFRTTPSIRASIARSRADASSLAEDEVVFVQRTGPRILKIPSGNPTPLSGRTLNDLRRGKLSQELGGGRRITGSRMTACPDIEVEKNGSYTLRKADTACKDMNPITINALDVWTGEVGKLREDVDINNLTFYSLKESLLPSYHSWKDHDAANEVKEAIKPDFVLSLFNGSGGTGRYIDLVDENREAAAVEKIANDPEEKLRTLPSIKPSDVAWEEIEVFFRWILEDEMKNQKPQISRLIRKEFNEAQWLLLTPAAATSLRFQIQMENTKLYQEALKTTFATQVDNLVTKLAMLCFGLPIAPITSTNIKYAGGSDDVPEKVPGDTLEEQSVQTVLRSEKPLEFLDVYHKRSYGYPMIRTKKKPYNAIDTKSADDDPRLAEIPERRTKFPWKSRRFGCGQSLRKLQDAPDLHLRGGGSEPVVKYRKRATYTTQKINVYTEMGRFEIDTYEALQTLITRLFRASVSKSDFNIDILQDAPPGLKNFTEVVQSFNWSGEVFDQDQFRKHVEKEEVQGKYKLRVRQGGNAGEPCGPEASDLDLVEIFLKDVGVAYWYLPVNRGDVIGINQYQDTFRNAIECLLPDHMQHVVQWELESKTSVKKQGQLVLAAEAPSKDLWEKILVQVKARISRVRINLKIIPKKELASTKKRLRIDENGSEGELMIVVPGSAKIAISPLFGGQDHEEFLERIRTAVHARTSPKKPAIRLWSGPENYSSEKQASRYVIFPPTKDKEDSGLLVSAGIILTADAIVVRPEFNNFRVSEFQNEKNFTSWDPQKVEQFVVAHRKVNYYSLDSFQKALRRLWPGYTTKEYVGIIQSRSNDAFVIGPEMTDQQWRFQVFDWLDDENVKVQRNMGNALIYKKPRLKGPLGVTYSLGVMPPKSERRVQTLKSIPAPTSVLEMPAMVTPREATARATWNAWVKKQDEAYEERLSAFTAAPSVFRRGKTAPPDISIFGQPFEDGLSVGSRFPTIFAQMKTPAQVNELEREKRKLENIILDRIQSCQMCSFTFPPGSIGEESKRQHLQDHITALEGIKKGGKHQFSRDLVSEKVGKREFSRDLTSEGVRREKVGKCESSRGLGSELRATHCGVCGLTEKEFEKKNPGSTHTRTCMEAVVSSGVDSSKYCVHCGLHLRDNEHLGGDTQTHIKRCSNRTCGPIAHNHVAVFERLLKRLTGQGTLPPGNFKCHFQHCEERFTSATSDSTKVNHFVKHLDIDCAHEKVPCQYPKCSTDLAGLSKSAVSRHLSSHFPNHDVSVEPPPPLGRKKASSAGGVDTNEDQKNIPQGLKKANPGKNFYCPVCYKLLGRQRSPCNWHRQNCQVFGHENWLILTTEEMKAKKEASPAKAPKGKVQVPKKRPTSDNESDVDRKPSAKRAKGPVLVKPGKKPGRRTAATLKSPKK